MKTIELDIDLISEELYLLILEEFKNQHPNVGDLDNWVIKADVEEQDDYALEDKVTGMFINQITK
jgi:hypothetical protein